MRKNILLNPHHEAMKNGKRKCFGCRSKDIDHWCVHRWWPQERRAGYAFRMFHGKPHLLPTCKRGSFDYEEQEEYKKKYCDALGISHSELSNGGGGGRGGRPSKRLENCEIF